MSVPRYFLPEHPRLTDVYSKGELRGLLQTGELSRSDMVTDDETGISYLLGDLLAMPFRDAEVLPSRSTSSLNTPQTIPHEFRADTPLPRNERDLPEPVFESDDRAFRDEDRPDEDEEGPDLPEDATFEEDTPPYEDDEPDALEEDFTGEELLYMGHPSWFAFPKSLMVAAVCAGSAVYFYTHNIGLEWLTLLGSISGLVLLFIGLDRTTTTYYVTTKRVEMEFGIMGRNTKEVRIVDIRAIDVEQEGMGAIIGLGTVKFDSSASAGPEVCFRDVRRPHDIKQLVRDLQG